MRLRVYGQHQVPDKGGVLILSNHQSFFDPIMVGVMAKRECAFMARDTLFKHPLFGRIIAAVHAFPVKRGSADIGAIKEAMRRLKQGWPVVLFPEGTRSIDGKIGPMLPGMVTLARKAKVPIVPAVVIGAYKAWPRNRRFPRIGNVVVEYARPIWPDDFADLSPQELLDEVRQRMLALQKKWHDQLPEGRLPFC